MFYLGFCVGAIVMTIVSILAYEWYIQDIKLKMRQIDRTTTRIEDKLDYRVGQD